MFMSIKIVIVGGVAGGASAAARLRRLDENAEIILFEKGQYISYANCGLPYYIGEVIKEKEKLLVQTPEKMKERLNIDVRVNSEVIKISPDEKLIEVKDIKENKIYTESYDKLILSPGAEPIKPNLPGIDSKRIFTLRNIPDTYAIKDYVDNNKPKSAVVVGAGFIGLEVAENLHSRGIEVTVVELADHVIGPLDFDMATIVHSHLKSKKVNLILKDGVKSFTHTDSYTNVELTSGNIIKTDMILMGIGVRPDTKLASNAGLTIGKTGGILVDEYMQTSNSDIYAVGDAVEIKNFISGNPQVVPLAGPANKQGRIAADNICGNKEKYIGTQGTSIVKVFDLTVAVTGNNEKLLQQNNVKYEKSFTHSAPHATYYPGGVPMSIKILFAKDSGKILGAQIVGYEGTDKRIDVIATAIRAGMTVYDLEELELAYAPPFSSAKDPVNIAGFVASNILKETTNIFHWDEIKNVDMKNTLLLDVREPIEFELGTIPGSVNIPLDKIRQRLGEIPKDKQILVFCQVGQRGYLASRILMQNGYKNVRNLSGGYKTYQFASEKKFNEDIYKSGKITEDEGVKSLDSRENSDNPNVNIKLDACGLQCPGPILEVYNKIKFMKDGEILSVTATDPAFSEDIKSWCQRTGNILLSSDFSNNTYTVIIKKKNNVDMNVHSSNRNDKTFVVFSNDLDKIIATFIIANGAAAMGRKVTLFFTFWGLNVLRKHEKVSVKKDIFGKMFGFMMPRGTKKLSLSKMNMGGMGALMIRYLMKNKNVLSLEDLILQAKENGVNFVACNMSMDIMGIKKEELIDFVTIGGVASFLGSAEESDMSLFI